MEIEVAEEIVEEVAIEVAIVEEVTVVEVAFEVVIVVDVVEATVGASEDEVVTEADAEEIVAAGADGVVGLVGANLEGEFLAMAMTGGWLAAERAHIDPPRTL